MSNKEKTDNPHDTRLKELFRNKDAFYSLLKDCVKSDWIDDLDKESLKLSEDSFILQDFKKKEADVVYSATLNNGREEVIFYVLLELQSKVDYRMNYRLLLYVVEILRHYYNQADSKKRDLKNFKFPAVIPIIFFNGNKKWTVPQNLKEMFTAHKRFGEYLLNFNYALVDVKGYDESSIENFQSKLLKIMMMFERSRDFFDVIDVTKKYKDDVINLNDEEKRILGVAFEILSKVHKSSQDYNLNEILYAKNAEGVESMLSNVIANAKNYERNLIKKAKAEEKEEAYKEKIESVKELVEMGLSDNQISKAMKMDISEVEKIKKSMK